MSSKILEEEDDLLNRIISDKLVCKTAMATVGLLKVDLLAQYETF